LRLDFINGKPKNAVERLVSVIRPGTLKALIESKIAMEKSDLKRDFFDFAAYLEKMAIIHDEHFHVVDHKKRGDSGTKNTGRGSDAGGQNSEYKPGGISSGGGRSKMSDRDRTKSDNGRSSDSSSTGKQSTRKPPPCLITKKCAGESHYLSDCPYASKDESIIVLAECKKK
jgi:hypothetical protein